MNNYNYKKVEIIEGVNDTSARVGVLGSSQIGAIVGLDGYTSRFDVYKAFNGIAKEISKTTEDTFAYGHILEESVAQMFTYKTGIEVTEVPYMYVDKENEHLVCHVDREAKDLVNGKRVALECKTVNVYASRDWEDYEQDQIPFIVSDNIPPQYYAQVMWYYILGDYDEVYISRLTNNKLYTYLVPRNREIEEQILSKVKSFYTFLKDGGIPEAISSKEASEKYKKETNVDSKISATEDVYNAYLELKSVTEKRDQLNKRIEELETVVKNYMEDKATLTYPIDGKEQRIVSWISISRTVLNSKLVKAKYPDIYEKCSKPASSRPFRLC